MGGCISKPLKPVEVAEGLQESEVEDDNAWIGEDGARIRVQGHSRYTSMFTRQGRKGINQDAMTVWEDFGGEKDLIFCGVFDGHGSSGQKVARHVRDVLPSKLSSKYKLFLPSSDHNSDADDNDDINDDDNSSPESKDSQDKDSPDDIDNQERPSLATWRASLVESFKEMDEELGQSSTIDCSASGTTAVVVVKQGDDLMVANIGDSRAILGTRDLRNHLVPHQLTNDLKPDLPVEKERITSCKGRVFSSKGEPEVVRMWAPDADWMGLAMSRAFGDFCLKGCGLISVPEVSHRKLTDKDEFVVLATDGVWDVLSNAEVLLIVESAKKRSKAPEMIIDRAVQGWRLKYPGAKIDDCAVICLFLKPVKVLTCSRSRVKLKDSIQVEQAVYPSCIGQGNHKSGSAKMTPESDDWSVANEVCRVNSIISFPRLARSLSWRKTSKDFEGVVSWSTDETVHRENF